jgi:hypothetical protein
MELNVRIEKDLPPIVPDAISFETGTSRQDLQGVPAYEHHGQDFTPFDRGALPSFFEDLLLGRPMPLVFATPRIQDIDTVAAIALFLHRDLATHPNTPGFIYTVDFVHRQGFAALAHVEERLARFFSALRDYFPEKGLSQREVGTRLTTAVGWIREYIHEGSLPVLGDQNVALPRVLDIGTNGFVLAEATGSLIDSWVELYRLGFLRGMLIRLEDNDLRSILIARKSPFIEFNLELAARILNQMETAMGHLPEWKVSPDSLWLESPPDGTLLLVQHVTEVLVRI